jgi:hypothetical protein
LIDPLRALLSVGVLEEPPSFLRAWDCAGEVEVDAPKERRIVGRWGRSDLLALPGGTEFGIDELSQARVLGMDGTTDESKQDGCTRVCRVQGPPPFPKRSLQGVG